MEGKNIGLLDLRSIFESVYLEFGAFSPNDSEQYWRQYVEDYKESLADRWRHNMKNYLVNEWKVKKHANERGKP